MTIDRLIDIVNGNSLSNLIDDKRMILSELGKMGLTPKVQHALMKKVLNIAKFASNQKTRESFLRSYDRIFQEGIYKDGRNGSITVEITKECNKNCEYCYSNSNNQNETMDDNILDIIVNFARKNYKHIFLTGGEPTLDDRVFSLAEKYPDIIFFMFTNGSTITDSYAKQLSCFGNLIPLISINGSSEPLHNQLKGDGSYKKVSQSIDNLNKYNISWGYISVVTEINAEDVLSQKFVKSMRQKGAFSARYLEYLPVGIKAKRELILSGETYNFLEQRKKEIMESGEIYIQDTSQKKCTGLLSFDVNGNIKNCVFFHFAKYNIRDSDLSESVKDTLKDWASFKYKGECPLYSDSIGFINHLEKLGWKHVINCDEEYLKDHSIAMQTMKNYEKFLEIRRKNNQA